MAQEIHKNTFQGGIVSDIDESLQPEGTYRDAYNVKIDKDGSSFIISNLAGTEQIVSINDSISSTATFQYLGEAYNLIGSVSAKTYFDTTRKDGIWIFVARKLSDSPSWRYNIFAIDTQLGVSYKVFEKDYNEDYSEANLDHSVFGEGGVNYIYATDGVGELKKVKCVVSTAQPLLSSEREIKLVPIYPSDEITVTSISQTGGALTTGSYQFVYRFVRKEEVIPGQSASRNIYSKWTLPTDPVLIHKIDTSNNATFTFNTYGGLGEETSKAINLSIPSISSEETSFYTHIELAVIENINGTTIPNSTAKMLFPFELPENAFTFAYKYKGTESGIDLPVSDIVIDSSAIQSAKTIAIKNNRLIAGNINYKNLEYDNGDVIVDSSSTPITSAIFRDDNPNFNPASVLESQWIKKRGYFRDETYRFAISYFDDKGNFSSPQTIDFSSTTANNATFGVPDFRFPERGDLGFGILSANNDPLSLGLRISNIQNHPSWARGFVILRARRKKKIKFQTPLVPTAFVIPQEVVGNYPTTAIDEDNATVSMADAQPPSNPLGTIVPKNFRYGHRRSIIKEPAVSGDMIWSYNSFPSRQYVVYPPEDLYNTDGLVVDSYEFSANDRIKSADAALLYVDEKDDANPPLAYENGDTVHTEVTSVFSADSQSEYYFGDGPATPIPELIPGNYDTVDRRISQYTNVENNQSSAVIRNVSLNFGDYDGLNATNGKLLPEGYPATNQKCKLITLSDNWYDVAAHSYSTNSVTLNTSGEVSFNGSQIQTFEGIPEATLASRNSYGSDDVYVSAVEIVNVEAPVSDERYGDKDSFNEFYFTGAYKRLSDSQVTNNTPITIDVWGGDCFVGYHTFKLTDTTYSIAFDEGTTAQAHAQKWGAAFTDGGTGEIERPIPVKAHNQYLRLYLESEVEPQFQDEQFFTTGITNSGLTSSDIREIYYQYGYNLSYSVQNILKTFFPESILSQDRDEFSSRIIYSDTKIYQSDVEGFDTFPVGNVYDQDESHGEITKLINKDGNVFSIQERAVSYIPTDSRLIETTDTSILSIRSDEFIGIPEYLTTFNGCSDIMTVREVRDGFIFLDRETKDLIKVVGQQVGSIADNKVKDELESWIDALSSNNYFKFTSGRNIESNEYYLFGHSSSGSFGIVYNNDFDVFPTKIRVSDGLLPINILYNKDEMWVVYTNGIDNANVNRMDSSSSSYSFLDGLNESSIEFVVNPIVEVPKMFNNVNIFSRGILGTVTTTSNHVPGSSIVDLTSNDLLEGTYRIKVLRGDDNRRLRGQYAKQNITWPTQFTNSDLIHVITKYDISKKPL